MQVRWEAAKNGGRPNLVEVPDSTEVLEADLVLLAMGFLGPEATLAEALGIDLDPRSNFKVGAPAAAAAAGSCISGSLQLHCLHLLLSAARLPLLEIYSPPYTASTAAAAISWAVLWALLPHVAEPAVAGEIFESQRSLHA